MSGQSVGGGVMFSLHKGGSVKIPVRLFALIAAIIKTAAQRPRAQINQDGKCSACGSGVNIENGRNFCKCCGATLLTPSDIAASRVWA
jgi:hypothetical protein